jgi:hypothetical protein
MPANFEHIEREFDPTYGYLLGVDQFDNKVYMNDFEFKMDTFWNGGFIVFVNKQTHIVTTYTFDKLFIDHIHYNFEGYLANTFKSSPLFLVEWWRLVDLMAQFYTYSKSADCFRRGGGISSMSRVKGEINKKLSDDINFQIRDIIIVEVRKLLTPPKNNYFCNNCPLFTSEDGCTKPYGYERCQFE